MDGPARLERELWLYAIASIGAMIGSDTSHLPGKSAGSWARRPRSPTCLRYLLERLAF